MNTSQAFTAFDALLTSLSRLHSMEEKIRPRTPNRCPVSRSAPPFPTGSDLHSPAPPTPPPPSFCHHCAEHFNPKRLAVLGRSSIHAIQGLLQAQQTSSHTSTTSHAFRRSETNSKTHGTYTHATVPLHPSNMSLIKMSNRPGEKWHP